MAIFGRKLRPSKGTVTNGHLSLYGNFTVTGTSGAISTSSCDGFSIARADVGRYTITLDGQVAEVLGVTPTLINTSASAAYGAGAGVVSHVRSDSVASAGTVVLQFTRVNGTTDNNDAEVANGTKVLIRIDLKLSSVNP
jgi:hypothetical protein